MLTVQDQTDSFLPTRSSLLIRLKQWNDKTSWDQFFDNYNRSIFRLGLKRGLTRVEAEEVVQETMVAVARQMPEFTYDRAVGSFKGWLYTITRRAIGKQLEKRLTDQKRRADPPQSDSSGEQPFENVPDPSLDFDLQWDREWKQNILQIAIDRVRQKVKPKQFQMFDLFVTQQLPMTQVTRMLNVNRAQVYMAKLRIAPLLRSEITALEKELI